MPWSMTTRSLLSSPSRLPLIVAIAFAVRPGARVESGSQNPIDTGTEDPATPRAQVWFAGMSIYRIIGRSMIDRGYAPPVSDERMRPWHSLDACRADPSLYR